MCIPASSRSSSSLLPGRASPPPFLLILPFSLQVRIRGVQVGQVLNVKPSLERVDVLCEVWGNVGKV